MFSIRPRLVSIGSLALIALMAGGAVRGAELFSDKAKAALVHTNVVSFAREFLIPGMVEAQIPGAAMAVVSDGHVLFQQGFGLAEVATDRPVSADKTLFRVASISKVFTAAAVLQLVEAKRLDLQRDVNAYLNRFKIAPTFARPVTLFHLLTHSGGFDVERLNYGARTIGARISLAEYLMQFQPDRIRPPGGFSSYDNYGYALAGYVVQRVSGERYSDYMEQHWLTPLGMSNSTFAASNRAPGRFARGYELNDEHLEPLALDFVNITPAAGLCATAGDMARFLTALTANVRPDGSRAFAPSIRDGLLKPQFAFDPELPGRCFGFNQVLLNGRRILVQAGSWPGFNSLLMVFPGVKAGLFIAYNRNDGTRLARLVSRAFAKRFLATMPAPSRHRTGTPDAVPDLAQFAGTYISLLVPRHGPFLELPRQLGVAVDDSGELEIEGVTYHALSPHVFERRADPSLVRVALTRRVAFRVSRTGRISHLVTERGAYRLAAWYETSGGQSGLSLGAAIVFISALVWWPVTGLFALTKGLTLGRSFESERSTPVHSSLAWTARAVAMMTGGLGLWLLVSRTFASIETSGFPYLYGMPESVLRLERVAPVLFMLGLACGGFGLVAWWRRFWNLAGRLHYSLVVAAIALVCLGLYQHNLLFP